MASSRKLKLDNQGEIRFYELLGNGLSNIRIRAPQSLAGDYSWTLPSSDGIGYVASDGAGNLVLQSGTSNLQSLDDTYNFGRIITADAGAVAIQSTGGLQVSAPAVFKTGPWYDVTHPDFGAVAGSDCTAAILAADAAAPSGATLFFPDNVNPYKLVAGAWKIIKSRTLLAFGGATIQALPGTLIAQPLIAVGDDTHPVSNFRCYNLNLDGNYAQAGTLQNGDLGANASSHGINLWNVTGAWIEGCYIYGIPGDGISCDYGDETNLNSIIWINKNSIGTCYRCNVAVVGGRKIWITNNLCQNYCQDAIRFEPNNSGETVGRALIEGNDCYPSATQLNPYNSNRASGITLLSPDDAPATTMHVGIHKNYIQGLDDGGSRYPVEAIRVQKYREFSVTENRIYKTRLGINSVSGNVDSGSSGSIIGNVIRECKDIGIQTMYGITTNGNKVSYCGGAGIRLYHNKNTCCGNILNGNGTNVALTYPYGIWVEGNGNIIEQNECFDDQTVKTQSYGIYMANGVDLNKVVENDCTGNISTAGIRPPPAMVSNEIRRNRGFFTEKSSTATINSGTTSVNVAHFLDITPREQDITLLVLNLSTNNPGRVYVKPVDIDSIGFIIRCENDPGASGLSIAWAIRERV